MRDNGNGSSEGAGKSGKVLGALREQLAGERNNNRQLQRQLTSEVEFARRAAEETIAARDDREEFRRVLAAAIANEKSSNRQVQEMAAKVETLEQELQGAREEKGRSDGRLQELERRLNELSRSSGASLAEERTRAATDARRYEEDLRLAAFERGEARGQAHELSKRVAWNDTPEARHLRARGLVSSLTATLSLILAVMVLPAVVFNLFSSQKAEYVRMLVGLSGWQLVGILATCLGLGLALLTWARRDFARARAWLPPLAPEELPDLRGTVRAEAAPDSAALVDQELPR